MLTSRYKDSNRYFQRIIGRIFSDMSNVRAHIDDCIIISKGIFDEHLKNVQEVLRHLSEVELQVNAEKCKWAAHKLPYLGLILTREGIEPDPAKVEALLNMAPPQNIKQLRRFLGGINFCRRIREYCTNILTLLTSLTRKVKFT